MYYPNVNGPYCVTHSILSPISASYLEDSAQEDSVYKVSMRHAIVPRSGFLILAADYSQLELRILAHMSGDEKLCLALNEGQDVFKTIAAAWKHKAIEMVTDLKTRYILRSNSIPRCTFSSIDQ